MFTWKRAVRVVFCTFDISGSESKYSICLLDECLTDRTFWLGGIPENQRQKDTTDYHNMLTVSTCFWTQTSFQNSLPNTISLNRGRVWGAISPFGFDSESTDVNGMTGVITDTILFLVAGKRKEGRSLKGERMGRDISQRLYQSQRIIYERLLVPKI